MNDLLLQAQINGMNDVVFGIKDLITIGGGIVATVTAYLTLKFNFNAHKEAQEKENVRLKEEMISVKSTKKAFKADVLERIKEVDEHNRARIDKTQMEMSNYKNKTDEEFKQINSNIAKVQSDTSKILGIVETIKNQS